ncbi:APL6 [Candida theae]|uniref:APL6 n=1 Tax=Candida theae TaxID=1198502 RepID=A0AAD5G044_9ASCO|nr:APL6 [Candida theae]KAI5963871.1 APL6 [Candida theae]
MNDSLSKITSMIESAKDLSLEAAMSASARLIDTQSVSRPQEISALLNSRSNRDISNGMKCVLGLIARGEDAIPYFADVVKNVTNENTKIKQMVFIYLTKYANVQADAALLSINSIQKTLNDKVPLNRANAIRSLAGIKIRSIIPILCLSLKRTTTDPSPSVRAASAMAIGKVYAISGKSKKQLFDLLGNLLADSEAVVVSAAIKAYNKISSKVRNESQKWKFIHGNYRRICSLLIKLDEWAQVYAIDVLTIYCRKFIAKPSGESVDPDLILFVQSLKPLMQSISDMVVLSVVRAIYLLAPTHLTNLDAILVGISSATNDTQTRMYALQVIERICLDNKYLFANKFRSFYVSPDDSLNIATSKISILGLISNEANFKYIYEELKYYSLHSMRKGVAKESIRVMARCSQISQEWSEKILRWSLANITILKGEVLNEVLTVVRYIVQQKCDTNGDRKTIEIKTTLNQLADYLNNDALDLENDAKASIIWTIGEYTALAENSIGPDVLRKALGSFARQAACVRYQLLVLASKIVAFEMSRLTGEHGDSDKDKQMINSKLQSSIEFKMFEHTLHLAKYDPSYDTRDRARMFSVLLHSGVDRAPLASLILQVPKQTPLVSDMAAGNKFNAIGSYFKVLEWNSDPSQLPASSIRKEAPIQYNKLSNASSAFTERSKSPSPVNPSSFSSNQFNNGSVSRPEQAAKSYKLQSLDEFFGNDDESSEEEEEDEEEDDEEGDDEEEEEGDDDDDDDDDDDGDDVSEVDSSDENDDEEGEDHI